MKQFPAIFLGAPALWLVFGGQVADAQTLRYGAEPGTTHTYVRVQQDNRTQTMNGSEQKIEVKKYGRFSATMADSNGQRVVKVVHDSLSIEGVPQGSIDFSAIYGKEVQVVMDDRGVVSEIVFPDSLQELDLPIDLTTTYRMFYPVLPIDVVEVGDSWSDTTSVKTKQGPLDMTIQRVNHYSVRGNTEYAGRTALEVDYNGKVAIEGSGTQQAADISLSGEGTAEGSYYLVPESGLYLGRTESSEIKMDAFVVSNGQNFLIPIVIQSEESVELVN